MVQVENKVGIKSETFTIQMNVGTFRMGDILALPNTVELEVISKPKLTWWDKVKKFFGLGYSYKYEVKTMMPKPRSFAEEGSIRAYHKHAEMSEKFRSFGKQEQNIVETLESGKGIMEQIQEAGSKVTLNPLTKADVDKAFNKLENKGAILRKEHEITGSTPLPKKRPAKRRKK